MRPLLKINFSDFWQGFNKQDNYFYNLLIRKYEVKIDDNPDILFYSCYGYEYLKFNCLRVFYTAENTRADFSGCDYALTFDHITKANHFRLPLYGLYIEQKNMMRQLLEKPSREEMRASWRGRKFCCMLVSNPGPQKRLQFFKTLNAVKPVSSGGKVFNNTGGPVPDKLAFIREYKFVLSFENEKYPGYTTEKILEPLFAGCIPVYWGNPLVNLDFNPRRFINYDEFDTETKLIDHLLELELDEEKALDILMEPVFNQNKIPAYIDDGAVTSFLDNIVINCKSQIPVARSPLKIIHLSKCKYYQGASRLKAMYRKINFSRRDHSNG